MALFNDLFKKKEKPHCPICGNEMGLLNGIVISDGQICDACEKMVRGQFDIEEYWLRKRGTDGLHREDYKLKTADPLVLMSVAEIREMIEQKKEQSAKLSSEFGSEYKNIARVEDCFSIAPKAMDVGLKRAKELKDRIVATSLVASGEIKRGDSVAVITRGVSVETKVIDVIICSSSSTFMTEMSANMGKHKAEAGVSAWILLDMTSGVEQGSVICC